MNYRSPQTIPKSPYRQKARDERRQVILGAAEIVFSSRGYHEASLTEIARQAEFAVGTIYLYFEDKADLYGSLIIEKMKQIVGLFESALKSGENASDSLRAAMYAQFAFHDANRMFFELFLHQHQVQSSPLHEKHWNEMEELKRRNLTAIEQCIVRGQEAGEIRPGPPRLYAVAFLGITLQMIRQWIREKGETPLAGFAEFAANCFLHGASTPLS